MRLGQKVRVEVVLVLVFEYLEKEKQTKAKRHAHKDLLDNLSGNKLTTACFVLLYHLVPLEVTVSQCTVKEPQLYQQAVPGCACTPGVN